MELSLVVVGSCKEYGVGIPPLSTGTPLRAELIGPTQVKHRREGFHHGGVLRPQGGDEARCRICVPLVQFAQSRSKLGSRNEGEFHILMRGRVWLIRASYSAATPPTEPILPRGRLLGYPHLPGSFAIPDIPSR